MKRFYKGVWVHKAEQLGKDKKSIREAIKRLSGAAFDLVIPCIKHPDGYFEYHTRLGHVRAGLEEFDPLEVITEAAKEEGVQVHPWSCVFVEGKNSAFLAKHKDLAAVDREGRAAGWSPGAKPGELAPVDETKPWTKWLCTAKQESRDYEFAIYEEIMTNYDVDGVHLDYIRTGTGCYCDYCQQASGLGDKITELTSKDDIWNQWICWRAGNVTGFVERVHKAATERGLEVSAAVFPHCFEAFVENGQDWVRWAKEGIVDYIFPMTYTMSTEGAIDATKKHVADLGGACPLWEGLCKKCEGIYLSTPALVEQIKGVLGEGADGIVIFQYPVLEDSDLEAIRALGEK